MRYFGRRPETAHVAGQVLQFRPETEEGGAINDHPRVDTTASGPDDRAMRIARRPNLRDEVASYLRHQIFAGGLRPGSRLDLDGLAATMGVSKIPLREALIRLESEGLVDSEARKGVFVALLTPDDILDHYKIFGSIVAIAVERSARLIGSAELERLDELLAEMENWHDEFQSDERLNSEFHRIINKAGGSRRLNSVIRQLSTAIPEHLYHLQRGWTQDAQREHRAILEALRAGDGPAASRLAQSHVEAGGRQAVKSLTGMGFWPEPDASTVTELQDKRPV
jgi:DNA-binding GntR family transcriptional regulator